MKIQFDPNLEYRQESIKSVTDIFERQEVYSNNFSVPSFDTHGLMQNETELELLGRKVYVAEPGYLGICLDGQITFGAMEEIENFKEQHEADDLMRVCDYG